MEDTWPESDFQPDEVPIVRQLNDLTRQEQIIENEWNQIQAKNPQDPKLEELDEQLNDLYIRSEALRIRLGLEMTQEELFENDDVRQMLAEQFKEYLRLVFPGFHDIKEDVSPRLLVRAYNEIIAIVNSEEKWQKILDELLKFRQVFAQNINDRYVLEVQTWLQDNSLTRAILRSYFQNDRDYKRFCQQVVDAVIEGKDVIFRGTKKRTHFYKLDLPETDERYWIRRDVRRKAVYKFVYFVYPDFRKIRNSKFDKKLQKAVKKFANGKTTIEPVLARLFKSMKPDDSRALARLIQREYDRILVPTGFRSRQLFKGIPHDDLSNPPRPDWEEADKERGWAKRDQGVEPRWYNTSERGGPQLANVGGRWGSDDIYNKIYLENTLKRLEKDSKELLRMVENQGWFSGLGSAVELARRMERDANDMKFPYPMDDNAIKDMTRSIRKDLEDGGSPGSATLIHMLNRKIRTQQQRLETYRWSVIYGDIENPETLVENQTQTAITPCHACGKTCSHGMGVSCGQCCKAMYCSKQCQQRDWIQGAHSVECWDGRTEDPDVLSREILMDLSTRTQDSGFPTDLGQPLSTLHVESAPLILAGLARRAKGAAGAAQQWLQTARVNHVAARMSDLTDADLLDTLDALIGEHNMIKPARLHDIGNAYDVHGKMTPEQRSSIHEFIGERAWNARAALIGESALKQWLDERVQQYKNWRGNRAEKIAKLKQDIREMERALADLRRQLYQKTWNPLEKFKQRREGRKAWKRGGPF